MEDLLVVEEQLDVDVRSLETCPYSAATFADILSKIQHAVDDLSLRQYSNLDIWVTRLDEEVEKKLAARLQAGVVAWTDALAGNKKDVDLSMDTDAPTAPTHKPGGDPKIQNAVHEIRITNQQMYLYPSIEEARFQITQQLFAWEAIVTSQTRLQSSRYAVCAPFSISRILLVLINFYESFHFAQISRWIGQTGLSNISNATNEISERFRSTGVSVRCN